jgi:RNA recognition motif-containing protein
MKIFMSNFGFNVEDEDLREFFTPYGEVISAEVVRDRETGKSKGFGFVVMKDANAARKAIAELHEGKVEGNIVKVQEARPKK